MKFDLQLFTEQNLKNQTPAQLRKGIRSFNKRIAEHLEKIENPAEHCEEWDSYDDEHRAGLIRHWQHEILQFAESIQNRVEELDRREEQP